MFSEAFEFPFKVGEPLVMTCHFSGIYDVNRNTTLPNDDFSLVRDWAISLQKHRVNGVIFHNNFSAATCLQHQHPQLCFISVTHDCAFSPNVYRYIVYREFLKQHASKISHLFVTDATDVRMLQNPFIDTFFKLQDGKLFCGDEPEILDNEWMYHHSQTLRYSITNYADFEAQFKNDVLLNCGIIGGNILMMNRFIDELASIHAQYNRNNVSLYTGDMGAFNYLARTRFNHGLIHGTPVNTVFKQYEIARKDCWFSHK
jgi:hypothetical protein